MTGGGESLGVFGEPLISSQNALVKRAASLRQRKFRDREGAFLAEGADVVAAGLAAGRRPQVVFLREDVADELGARLGLAGPDVAARVEAEGPPPAVFVVSDRVAARISTLETPADAVAVFPLPERQPLSSLLGRGSGPKAAALRRATAEPGPELLPSAGLRPDAGRRSPGPSAAEVLVVYVDGVQDPGNLGTLIRAAVAFGATALVTSAGCADPYGPKAVRAGMGALFGLHLFRDVPLADVLDQIPVAEVFGLSAHDGAPLAAAELRRPAVLAIGAERAGLSRAVRARVTRMITIPLAPAAAGVVESLNAGVAGAIALYEFSRRPAGASDDPPRRPAAPAKG